MSNINQGGAPGFGNRTVNDTAWSNRYSRGAGGVVTAPSRNARWMPAALLVLLIAVVLLGIFGGRALVYQGKSEMTFINRMLTECDEAISTTGSLSRSGGAESAAILGRIRANIRAIDTINEVRNTVAGSGYFVPPYVFTELYGVIDSYSNNLKLGNVTIENLTDLNNGLTSLRDMLAELN